MIQSSPVPSYLRQGEISLVPESYIDPSDANNIDAHFHTEKNVFCQLEMNDNDLDFFSSEPNPLFPYTPSNPPSNLQQNYSDGESRSPSASQHGDIGSRQAPPGQVSNEWPSDDIVKSPPVILPNQQIQIIAQPRTSYRERYGSEICPEKNRAQRFIRTEDGNKTHEYPTIKIPEAWRIPSKYLYVRVTLVTVLTDHVQNHCVHPYPIDTSERDVIKDQKQNSLYFRVTSEEFRCGEKSFRITRKKMVQSELRNYGRLRLFDSTDADSSRDANYLYPQDPKKMIEFYELWKSQLVFMLAELFDQQTYPTSIFPTAAISHITVDIASEGRKSIPKSTDSAPECKIRCIPQRVYWKGNEPVALIFPNPIKQRVYQIRIEFDSLQQYIDVQDYVVADRKTLIFQAPPCPFTWNETRLFATLCIMENLLILARFPFEYVPMNQTNFCTNCSYGGEFQNKGKKRFIGHEQYFTYDSTDGGEILVDQMSKLTIEQKPKINSPSKVQGKSSDWKIDKYLNQLKDAVTEFVRTDDPSTVLRRTRVLLAKSDEPFPLHVAIEKGFDKIGLHLTEQVLDMNNNNGLLNQTNSDGQTAFLLAAKFDRWAILKIILQQRLDLVEQTDLNENNFLHFLAENQSTETIQKSIEILPDEVLRRLFKATNKKGQTPKDVALSIENEICQKLLHIESEI